MDDVTQNNVAMKKQILKHLEAGKAKLAWLEAKVLDEKKIQKLRDEFEKSKQKMADLKDKFNAYEEKAVQYIELNPKKALAMATAAGVLAGALWGSSGKTTVKRKK